MKPLPLRQFPNLFHRRQHNFLGHVAYDLNLADLGGQNEVHLTVARLFIRVEATGNVARPHIEFRQPPDFARRDTNAVGILAVQLADLRRNARRGHHAPRHCLSVQQTRGSRFPLREHGRSYVQS